MFTPLEILLKAENYQKVKINEGRIPFPFVMDDHICHLHVSIQIGVLIAVKIRKPIFLP